MALTSAPQPCRARVSIFIGTVAPLPGSGRPTAIFKHPVSTSLALGPEGFAGDQQADRRVHGGPEKAVHLYPAAHYARLAERFPEAARQLIPGSLGENLSTPDLSEGDVRLGDVFALGQARLQICQPRSPCWKIDARFDVDGMAAFIAENGLTGWYWRVLAGGRVDPGDALEPVESSPSAPILGQAMAIWRAHRPSLADLDWVAATPGIADGWGRKIRERADWLRRQVSEEPPPPPLVHRRPD